MVQKRKASKTSFDKGERIPLPPVRILDPEQLYRTNYDRARLEAHGLERYVWQTIPYQYLRSFALTFDPRSRFLVGSQSISPPTRTRIKTRSPPIGSIDREWKRTKTQFNHDRHYGGSGVAVCGFRDEYVNTDVYSSSTWYSSPSMATSSRSEDTSVSTRPVNVHYGEFENFKYTVWIPPKTIRNSHVDVYDSYYAPCPYGNTFYSNQITESSIEFPAVYRQSSIDLLRSQVIARLNSSISNNVERLVARALPTGRRYSIFRNIIELRDLPRSIVSLRKTVADLGQSLSSLPRSLAERISSAKLAKHVPEEYVSFWFGWRQTYSDIVGLLQTPARISRDVNRMIERSGKATTYRATHKEAWSDNTYDANLSFYHQPWVFTWYGISETNDAYRLLQDMETEVRIMINAKFDFPTVGRPQLRQELFNRKLGLYPTITDVYNLVPWTWLIDWFTGLGNYVEMIDTINRDPSLINYGFVTAVGDGKLSTVWKTHSWDSTHHHFWNSPADPVFSRTDWNHTCTVNYKGQVRKDIASGFGVKSILEPGSLSPYQNSILGGILLGRRRG